MKSYKIIFLALAALSVVSCADKAQIKGNLKDAPDSQVIVKQLAVNVYNVLDTLKTDARGDFSYSLPVTKGQPEFVYLFHGDTRIAALLLEAGETARVMADTLGVYEVTGSESSQKLAEVEKNYSDFVAKFYASGDAKEMSKMYVDYYRNCVKYVLTNSKSMTAIPVLYQTLGPDAPIFSQISDALFFRSVADSLKTVYPESPYVKALEKEASRRGQLLMLNNKIQSADSQGFPDISLPGMDGARVSLSSLEDKVVLVHFWTSTEDAQKAFNIENLLPVYEEFHDKGFEIYAVCIDPDKTRWASVVRAQNLPWINVNDGLGLASQAVSLYNVDVLPTSLLIVDKDIYLESVVGVDGLRKELRKLLK